jgi:hypothetical protein
MAHSGTGFRFAFHPGLSPPNVANMLQKRLQTCCTTLSPWSPRGVCAISGPRLEARMKMDMLRQRGEKVGGGRREGGRREAGGGREKAEGGQQSLHLTPSHSISLHLTPHAVEPWQFHFTPGSLCAVRVATRVCPPCHSPHATHCALISHRHALTCRTTNQTRPCIAAPSSQAAARSAHRRRRRSAASAATAAPGGGREVVHTRECVMWQQCRTIAHACPML